MVNVPPPVQMAFTKILIIKVVHNAILHAKLVMVQVQLAQAVILI